jgi:alginate O-acetyltransferase complex protein AlgI
MSICSLAFLLFCGVVVIVFHLAPSKPLRQILLTAFNAAFLYTLVPNQRSWIWFAVFLAGTYVSLLSVRASRRGAAVTTGIVIVLAVFLYLKRYQVLAGIIPFPLEWELRLHPVELVGLSYMIFKFIHMLVDEWQGQLAPFNLWRYLNYQLSFFTITAGPIQRYNAFLTNWEEMDLSPSLARDNMLSWCRILTGMIKISVLGAFAYSAFFQASRTLRPHILTNAAITFYSYPLYLYLNFSGYTDVMIGAAGLLGFKLPENFNRPYLARNMLEFWDRWHITLTHWIRDYVFMSSYKVAATRYPSAAKFWSYALLFAALFLAGLWHGATDGFVAFGALIGLGATVTRAYGDAMRTTLGRAGMRAYLQNPALRVLAIVITLNYVCLCQLFFATGVEDALKILGAASTGLSHLPRLFTGYAWEARGVALFVCAMVVLAALWKADAIAAVVTRVTSHIGRRPTLLYTLMSAETAIVVFMFFIDWAVRQEPPPVLYRAF